MESVKTTDLRTTMDLKAVTIDRRKWKNYKDKQKIEKLKAEVAQLKSEKDCLHTFPASEEDGVEAFDGTERLKVSQAWRELCEFVAKNQAQDHIFNDGGPGPFRSSDTCKII